MSGEYDAKTRAGSFVEATLERRDTNGDPGKRSLTERIPLIQSRSRAGSGGNVDRSFEPYVDRSYEPSWVQRRSAASNQDAADHAVQTAARHGIAGSSTVLPHIDVIQRAFGRHDVSKIQAHTDEAAATGARAMGAEAFATGNYVAFAGAPSLHTAAHEATHVVQQRAGVQLKGGVGEVGDAYEQHADAVADRVAVGESAQDLLDQCTVARGAGPTVQRAPGAAVQRAPGPGRPHSPQQEQPGARVDRLIHLLTTTPAVAGPESWDEAYAFLAGLRMPDLLDTMSGAVDRGFLPQLIARSNSAGAYGRGPLLSALYAIELSRSAPSSVTPERLNQAGVMLDQIPQDQQLQVLEYLLHRKGSGVSVTTLVEGVIAMRERGVADPSAATGHGASAAGVGPAATTTAPSGAPSPIEPDPWAPPGEQPIPLYIGNEAHIRIAREYATACRPDRVLANFFSISSILSDLKELSHPDNADALSETELGLMPDIVNLNRLHLYEIKPVNAQALGAARASLCVGLFGRAGIAMQLGPTGEPGTSGGLPAPGGVYMFWSPEPGVIVYQYRKGRLVPVPVVEPEPVVVRRWRFELQPMTQQQQQAVTTLTVGGALLLIGMILLAPAGI